MKRLMLIWALPLALIALGCAKKESAGGGKPAASENGPVSLSVSAWDVATSGYYSELVKQFNAKYPNIQIHWIDTPSTDYTQKLTTMLNGGSQVDVFWIKDGDTTRGYANRGQLADLKPFADKSGVNLADFQGLAERFTVNGKLVGLPARGDYYVLYYNKDHFDKAGVPYPSNDMTWEEFETLAGRLTSGSGQDKVWGSHFHTWQALVENWAIQDGKHTIVDTDYSFMKPYYEMVLRLQDAKYIQDYATLKAGNVSYGNAFLAGNVATMPMGTWFSAAIIQDLTGDRGKGLVKNWGIATMPHPQGTPAGWTVGSFTPICMNEASKTKDAAWDFINFVTGPEGAKIYASFGQLPGRATPENLATIAGAPGMPEGSLEALTVKNIILDRAYVDYVVEVNTMLGQEHGSIMLKEKTVDQGLADIAKRAKEIQGIK